MSYRVAYYFAVFAIIILLVRTKIVSVRGQCTTEGCENGDPSMRTVAETQQTSAEVFRQLGAVLTSLQAIDQRRLQEHYIYIEQGLSVTRLLNESFRDMKNQFASVVTSLHAVNRRLQEHDISIKNHNAWKLANGACGPTSEVCDCSDIKANGQNASGVYVVCAGRQRDRICTDAFCDMETANRASLVCQRRKDGSVNFYRTWAEYREGFGDSNVEFWLGNEMLHLLTSKRNYKLRIDLEDWEGNKRFAEYGRFSISSSVYNYTLDVSEYSGNAGDGFSGHNGQQFSTKDARNDKSDKTLASCAIWYQGAWWYNKCYDSNLNGIYHHVNQSAIAKQGDGIVWSYWLGGWYSLKSSEMKLIPVA